MVTFDTGAPNPWPNNDISEIIDLKATSRLLKVVADDNAVELSNTWPISANASENKSIMLGKAKIMITIEVNPVAARITCEYFVEVVRIAWNNL